jgi:uncharacterized protein (DUF1697 family)
MPVFVAFLRAVNVGGTGKLPMRDLKTVCEERGLRDVATYIASGNLVFRSPKAGDASTAALARLLGEILRERFGLPNNQALIRTPDRLAEVIERNPFAVPAAKRPNLLMVSFLDATPPPSAAAALAAYRGPEQLHLDGDHLYIDYVEGAGRSKLTPALLAKALQVAFTARNWNTTNKLLAMGRALEG